jgi:GAF domain-containing protein/HAMP domain-containing protein
MSENQVSTPSQHSVEELQESGPSTTGRPEKDRAKLIQRTIQILTALAALNIALYLLLYLQHGILHLLVDSGGTVLSLGCLALARRSIRRGELDVAGYWILVGIAISFGIAELVWTGETLYHGLGGVLAILLVGSVTLPHKPRNWLVAGSLYVTGILLINLFEPVSRYNAITESSGMLLLDLSYVIILASLALAIFWRFARAYQHIRTIRVRLPALFVLMVLLPVVAVGFTLFLVGSRNGRQQAINQLESVARIKEAEIDKWVENLQADLNSALSASQVTPRAVALLQTPAPFESQEFWMQSHLQGVVKQTARLEELFLIDVHGQIILSTDVAQAGENHSSQTYFQQGLNGFYVQPPAYVPSQDKVSMMIAIPVIGPGNRTVGILAGRVNPDTLNEIMGERAWLGDTGEVFLVDRNGILLTAVRRPEGAALYVPVEDANVALETQGSGSRSFQDYRGASVVGVYHWMPELETALVAKQDQSEALRITNSTLSVVSYVSVIILAFAVVASLFITQSITGPLASLTDTATRIAAGNLTLTTSIKLDDEIGALARAFDSMTARLRQTLEGLEQQVAERTADLEATMADLAAHSTELEETHRRQVEINRQLEETVQQSERRATLLQASAQVSRAIVQIQDLETLLPQITHLISQHFGFYHAGIFLIDQAGRYAVLRATNSQGGQRMLERHHKLEVGSQGIVGYVTGTGQPRIALNVGADAVFFNNPDLPETRSEMALPLRIGDEIIGALDVQSIQESAFEEQDISVLEALADQIAIAIGTANLLQRTQTALEEAQQIQRRYVQQEWFQFMQEQPNLAHEYTLSGVSPVGDAPLPEAQEAWSRGELIVTDHASDRDGASSRAALAVPIKFRDETIGILDLQETQVDHVWTEDQIALAQAIADQLGQALEGARLFERTQASLAETQTLFETSRSLAAAQEMDEIWQAIINAAKQRRADACALLLFDTLERENALSLVLAAGWEQHDPIRLPVGTQLPLSDFAQFDTLRPGLHYSVTDLSRPGQTNEGTRQLMATLGFSALHHQPIAVRDRWFGLLTILYESAHAFTDTEINFYRTLSDQAALALESQRLLAETQRRAEREQMIRQITDKVRATPDLEMILQTTVREMSKVMGLPRVFVRLGTEKELAVTPSKTNPKPEDNNAPGE